MNNLFDMDRTLQPFDSPVKQQKQQQQQQQQKEQKEQKLQQMQQQKLNNQTNAKSKLIKPLRLSNDESSKSTSAILSSASFSNKENSGFISSRTVDSSSLSGASYTHSAVNSSTNNSTGLFDRFLKNYTSSSSVQDEPELSFVSYQTISNPVSPSGSTRGSNPNIFNNNNTNNNQTNQTGGFKSISVTSTSGVSSNNCHNNLTNTTNTNTSMDKTLNNFSLIQFQQKQLMKQFANVSPIENQLVELHNNTNLQPSMPTSNLNDFSSINCTIMNNFNINQQNNDINNSTYFEKSKYEIVCKSELHSTKMTEQDSHSPHKKY
jgi:hypothetical protein